MKTVTKKQCSDLIDYVNDLVANRGQWNTRSQELKDSYYIIMDEIHKARRGKKNGKSIFFSNEPMPIYDPYFNGR